MNTAIKYRPDIDGLRAVAVLPVVLYHAGTPMLSGGYVGVDVFFVISGFLIAGIISREIQEKRFSLIHFYERRARRILPALFSVLFVTLLAGWLLSWPSNFVDIAESVFATLFFGSNFYFWLTTDYFSTAAEYRPLLHTWSLAVEEQFYIVFPLLLMLVANRSRRLLLFLMFTAFVLSFAISVLGTQYDPVGNFYLAPSRAWELLMGVFLALNVIRPWRSRYLREFAALTGITLIGFAVVLYDSNTAFPGWTAVMPCLGTALLIQAGRGEEPPTFISTLLSHRVLVFVGLISYSLYLWHWPMLAFARSWLEMPELPLWWASACVLASMIIAGLSWHYVERPFRTKGLISRRQIFHYSGIGMVSLVACSVTVVSAAGFSHRFSPETLDLLAAANDIEDQRISCMGRRPDGRYCVIGARDSEPTVMFWGDSHAAALMSAVSRVLEIDNTSSYLASHNACPPLLGIRRKGSAGWKECQSFNTETLEFVRNNSRTLDVVILAARWPLNVTGERAPGETGEPVRLEQSRGGQPGGNAALVEAGLRRMVLSIAELGMEVIILGGVPEIGWDVPRMVAAAIRRGVPFPESPTIEDVELRHAEAERILTQIGMMDHVTYVPLAPLLCEPACEVVVGNRPIYVDGDHLSQFGASTVLGPRLAAILSGRLLQPTR